MTEQHGEHAAARWTVTSAGGHTVVTLSGELDLAAVRGPTQGILGALKHAVAGETLVVCDMSGVDYIDSSGFHLLVQLRRSVEADGVRFVLSRPSERVYQLLRVAGVEDLFDIHD
jgi:anti-anti-sigma factor